MTATAKTILIPSGDSKVAGMSTVAEHLLTQSGVLPDKPSKSSKSDESEKTEANEVVEDIISSAISDARRGPSTSVPSGLMADPLESDESRSLSRYIGIDGDPLDSIPFCPLLAEHLLKLEANLKFINAPLAKYQELLPMVEAAASAPKLPTAAARIAHMCQFELEEFNLLFKEAFANSVDSEFQRACRMMQNILSNRAAILGHLRPEGAGVVPMPLNLDESHDMQHICSQLNTITDEWVSDMEFLNENYYAWHMNRGCTGATRGLGVVHMLSGLVGGSSVCSGVYRSFQAISDKFPTGASLSEHDKKKRNAVQDELISLREFIDVSWLPEPYRSANGSFMDVCHEQDPFRGVGARRATLLPGTYALPLAGCDKFGSRRTMASFLSTSFNNPLWMHWSRHTFGDLSASSRFSLVYMNSARLSMVASMLTYVHAGDIGSNTGARKDFNVCLADLSEMSKLTFKKLDLDRLRSCTRAIQQAVNALVSGTRLDATFRALVDLRMSQGQRLAAVGGNTSDVQQPS